MPESLLFLMLKYVTGQSLEILFLQTLITDRCWTKIRAGQIFSWNLIDEKKFVFNTTIDRAWIEFTGNLLQIRLGRQRINWSQSLVWNPNDIFNTYSFFDFDYVERPGSDAIRIIYSPTASSAAETAVKVEHNGSITAAALYRFSFSGVDIQFLGGEMSGKTFVAGSGWSGAIGSWSIRGEATWFQPYNRVVETKGTGIFTLGTDKTFSEKLTGVVQIMYCNRPVQLFSFSDLYYGGLTAAQLAFSDITAMGQLTWTPMPLINVTGSGIWYHDLKGFFAGPSIDISITENVDFSFMWQYFHSTINNTDTRVNLAFLRFRYSF